MKLLKDNKILHTVCSIFLNLNIGRDQEVNLIIVDRRVKYVILHAYTPRFLTTLK